MLTHPGTYVGYRRPPRVRQAWSPTRSVRGHGLIAVGPTVFEWACLSRSAALLYSDSTGRVQDVPGSERSPSGIRVKMITPVGFAGFESGDLFGCRERNFRFFGGWPLPLAHQLLTCHLVIQVDGCETCRCSSLPFLREPFARLLVLGFASPRQDRIRKRMPSCDPDGRRSARCFCSY